MRLKNLPKVSLGPDQRILYDAIVDGPRAKGRQLFPLSGPDGVLTGPFGIMVHFPGLGTPLQELGSAIRFRSGLTDRVREIAILCVAEVTGSAFERYAHERIGRAAGLTDADLAGLASGRFASADPAENAAYGVCRRLLASDLPMADADYADLRQTLGEAAIFELVTLVGYYRTLAQLLHVFDVGAPESGQT